jgi:hypothetical protein
MARKVNQVIELWDWSILELLDVSLKLGWDRRSERHALTLR